MLQDSRSRIIDGLQPAGICIDEATLAHPGIDINRILSLSNGSDPPQLLFPMNEITGTLEVTSVTNKHATG